jgi:hypothetical protein
MCCCGHQVHRTDLHLFCPKNLCQPFTATNDQEEKKENMSLVNRQLSADDYDPCLKKQKRVDNPSAGTRSVGVCGTTLLTSASRTPSSMATESTMQNVLTLFSQDFSLLSPGDLLTAPYQHIPLQQAPLPLSGLFTIGVKQLWVSSKHRRRGIARQMLECIRNSAPGNPRCPLFIPAHERFRVAFSQPTSDGLRCAMRYVAPAKAVWLYSRSSVNVENERIEHTGGVQSK